MLGLAIFLEEENYLFLIHYFYALNKNKNKKILFNKLINRMS